MKHFIYIAYLIAYVFIGSFANAQTDTTLTFAPGIYKEALFLRDDTIIFNRIDDSTSTVFNDTIKLLNCHFPKPAQFRIDTFNKNVYFNKYSVDDTSVFYDSVDFYKTLFKGKACFQRSKFLGKTNFRRIHIKGKAYFEGSQFYDTTFFRIAYFYKEVRFRLNTFYNHLDFSKTVFYDSTYFDGSTFKSNTKFDSLEYFSIISFNNAKFLCNELSFIDIKPKNNSASISFINTILPDTINFYLSKQLSSPIDFRYCDFDSNKDSYRYDKKGNYIKHKLILYKSDISKFRIDFDHFELLMIDPTTGRELNKKEASKIYEELLKNFKINNPSFDYEALDIEYREYKIKNGDLFMLFKKHMDYYGYGKSSIIKTTGLILFLFTIITVFLIDKLNTNIYPFNNIPNQKAFYRIKWKLLYNKNGILYTGGIMIKHIWYSFLYTSIIFFFLGLKVNTLKFHGFYSTLLSLYVILVYISGIVCIAYWANYFIKA